MSDQRLAYDDAASTADMVHDCEAVSRALHLEACPHHRYEPAAAEAPRPSVTPELARRATELHLHFH